jgi:hypothetical protein
MRKIVIIAFGVLLSVGARADIAPAPGETERLLLGIIEKAGYPCEKVASFKFASEQDADISTRNLLYERYVVECANGKSYWVVLGPRRPQRLPNGEFPVTPPVVKPIDN